ncbi:alpha/beta fold hydrolase [Antrihabitans stalactiti]|uniref:Alpha/beta hydrolase n=1 Tax=Antrihabitans stalactiti TaxID=2584121 RepID=A0A848KAK5_9NOCA|nr:alpha/beta hydrolase [Antrihabitans stalactiti]NMN95873.1 alpha/beta hydrolase [Antrihabitans stalactiti]
MTRQRKRIHQVVPTLPSGSMVRLGERGETFVRDIAGPSSSIPVVLLHGWTWTADLNFADVFVPLSRAHRVIAPDLRMHGRGVRDGGFTLTDAGDDVIALLDVLGIEHAILCGYSMGGGIAADVVARYPDRVVGTVISGTAACYVGTPRDRMIFAGLRALQPLAIAGFDPRLGVFATAALRRRSTSLASRWDWARVELGRTSLADMLAVGRHIPSVDLRVLPPNAQPRPCEYLLLAGDRLCRPHLQRELAEVLGARITEVEANHDLPITNPEWFAELMIDAVAELTDRISRQQSRLA